MVESATTPTTTTTTSFPVVLYDGNHETPVGNIQIYPDLVFRSFQTKLTEMTGISYNNLTTYLVDSTKVKNSPDRRKILITGKVKFSVIVRETNCYFFVVLKRSRRDRRRKVLKYSDFDASGMSSDDLSRVRLNRNCFNVKQSDLDALDACSDDLSRIRLNRNSLNVKQSDLDEVSQIRLNRNGLSVKQSDLDDISSIRLNRNVLNVKPSDLDELSRITLNRNGLNGSYYYDERFHDMLMNRVDRVNRGEYMKMILNSGYEFEFDSNLNVNVNVDFPAIEDAYPRVQRRINRLLCEDCTVAEKQGKSPEFHLCVYDEVVLGWLRSPAGPISRPR